MKRFISAILCVLMIAAVSAGCGYKDALSKNNTSATQSTEAAQEATPDEPKAKDFDDNLNGLCDYFGQLGYVTLKDDKIDESLVVKMDASLIGAKEGKKFNAKYGSQPVTIELYEYDLNNLNDTAKSVIDSVKQTGKFTILDLPEVEAYLSDSGKYMLIYSDESIDDENPDKESDSYKHRQEVIEHFKAFN